MQGAESELLSVKRRADKWARTHAPSKEWRERLLRTCLERMKTARTATLQDRRKERMRIVLEETARIRPAQPEPTSERLERDTADERELLALLEDWETLIEAEKKEKDERLHNTLESVTKEADDDVAELVHFHQTIDNSADDLLCPVCANGHLAFCEGRILCPCGLQLDCGTCDNVTMPMVRERLAQVVQQHGTQCSRRLYFAVRNTFGQFLWACCTHCRFDIVVL